MKRSYIRGTWQPKRAFSPAVITEGAPKIIWLAGHTGQTADDGRSLAGDFEAQCRQTFRNLEKTLADAGAKLTDLVTMTVFLADSRHTTRMTEIRAEILGKDFRKRRHRRDRVCRSYHADRDPGRRGSGVTAGASLFDDIKGIRPAFASSPTPPPTRNGLHSRSGSIHR